MAKITPGQIRAARALLAMSQPELADFTGVSVPTIKRAESDLPHIAKVAEDTRDSIIAALQAAGIEFTNGNAPGVRLVGPRKPKPSR
jgi:transcriptional regulator with XRE-family HTH domain